jgi:aspartate dehydrogenase
MATKTLETASIGLIGYGTIARDLHRMLSGGGGGPQFTLLLRAGSPSRQAVPTGIAVVSTVTALVAVRPDIVVEAAGQRAAAEHLPDMLEAGIAVIMASTGALADPKLFERLANAAERGGTRLILPAGAIGGLDYLRAAAGHPSTRICYTSRKPPASFREELAEIGHDADTLRSEVLLFEGSAAAAAQRYPRNLNVAFSIALAVGLDRLTVKVLADPFVVQNTHEIDCDGALGQSRMSFANTPSPDNPKTSMLTAYSLRAALERQFQHLQL